MPGECLVQGTKAENLDFWTVYANLCIKNSVCPQRCLRRYLEPGVLDCPLERLKEEYWTPFLEALAVDRSLKYIVLQNSSLQNQLLLEENKQLKKRRYPLFPVPPVLQPDYISRLCVALSKNVIHNDNLRSLCLEGLTFLPKQLSVLTTALQKSSSLQHFSIAKCPVGDKGIETLCHNLRNLASVRVVDLSNCDSTERGAKAVSALIKFQAIRRHGEAWMESLRYRKPKLDGLSGITRFILNNNCAIGNAGAEYLADALADDMWIKALDLQCCGIGEPGARSLIQILPKNYTLEILDVRQNPLIAKDTMGRIVTQLKLNTEGKVCEYEWLPLQSKVTSQHIRKHKGRSKSATRSKSSFVPRQRSLSAGPQYRKLKSNKVTVRYNIGSPLLHASKHAAEASSISQTETSSETDLEYQSESYNQLKKEIETYRQSLCLEREAKKQVEERLMELSLENKKLHERLNKMSKLVGCTLVDDTTLTAIQTTFAKFQSFLKLLQKAGLQDLLKGKGIYKSFIDLQQSTSAIESDALPNLLVTNEQKACTKSEHDLKSASPQSIDSLSVAEKSSVPNEQSSLHQAKVKQTVTSIKRLVNAIKENDLAQSYDTTRNTSQNSLPLSGNDESVRSGKSPVDELFKYAVQHASLANKQLLQSDEQPKISSAKFPSPSGSLGAFHVKSANSQSNHTSLKSAHEVSNSSSVSKTQISPSGQILNEENHVDVGSSSKDNISELHYSNTFEPSSGVQTSASDTKTGTDSESIPEILTGSDNDDF